MTESDIQDLLRRYLTGHCTPQEAQLVERLYQEMGRSDNPGLSPPEQEKLLGAMWQRLEARTRPAAPAQQPAAFWRQPAALRWAAAALLALGVGAGLLAPGHLRQNPVLRARGPVAAVNPASPLWTRHLNATRQQQAITLPDGSEVTLSPGSSLRYAAGLAGPKRAVYFSGDAFFKVRKNPDRPFLVLTRQVVTTVLGTSFRVRALAGSPTATVAVREGRVAVQARAGAHLEATPNRPAAGGVLLLANQQVVYSATAPRPLRKELAPAPAMLAPQSFVFDARPVPEVLAALSKAYGVDIDYDHAVLAGCTVTLDLTNKSLAGKLSVLCEALGATYEEADARIIFHSAGCKGK